MLRLMKKSGCYQMSLGIESANQRILDMIKKRLKREEFLNQKDKIEYKEFKIMVMRKV